MIGMCFYNQKLFDCGCWRWNGFSHRCHKEYRTGETCGLKLVSRADRLNTHCRICEKIEIKERRISAEKERVARWEKDGGNFKASMERSRKVIAGLERDLVWLRSEREERKRTM